MAANDWINKAKTFAQDHKGQVQGALDKAEQTVSSKTGGKYDEKFAKGRGMLQDKLGIPAQSEGAQGGSTQDVPPAEGSGDTTQGGPDTGSTGSTGTTPGP